MTDKEPTGLTTTGEKKPGAIEKLEAQLFANAHSPEERALVFREMSKYRQSQIIREAATAIAAQSWGANVSVVQCAALSRYALETGTDPVRHWTFIAGMPYDKAELWMDLIAAEPTFIRDESQLLHDDDRCSEDERAARRALRGEHGVPEEVKAAALVTLYFNDRGPFQGVNWAGSHGKKKDPIGDDEPTKTALTRAYRKAAKKAVPLWFKNHPMMETLERLGDQARAAMEAGKDPVTGLQDTAQRAGDMRVDLSKHGLDKPGDPYALGRDDAPRTTEAL